MSSKLESVARPAETAAEILPHIAARWSSRAIDPEREVPEDVMTRLFEAARWSASSGNQQPWGFAMVTKDNPELFEAVQSTLTGGNYWALKAPVLVFAFGRKRVRIAPIPNRLQKYDVGMSVAHMALQAVEEGLVFHQMAGFNPMKLGKVLKVPGRYAVLSAIAVGYPGPTDHLSDKHIKNESEPRERRTQAEFLRINTTCETLD